MTDPSRPDAIIRAQMPESADSNPSTPIIIGIVAVIIVFVLLLLFIVIIPQMAMLGAERETTDLDDRILENSERGAVIGNHSDNIPKNNTLNGIDPSMSRIEAPLLKEQQTELKQIDS